MRKQLLNVFLPLLLTGLMASAAETPAVSVASQPSVSQRSSSQRNELQRVNVIRGTDEIRVEIDARGAVTPKLSTADSPARLIVDLPGTAMATAQRHIGVGSSDVKGIRIGMDGSVPPTTRIVVDLEHSCRYDMSPAADGKLVLTVHSPAATAAAATAPKPISPFAAHVIEVKAEPKRDSETAVNTPPAVVYSAPKSVTPATIAPAVKTDSPASTDFVFVEPTYAAKAATTDVTPEPAVRSEQAAAKFSDKTAAELLPVSMNAAQASQSVGSSTGIQPAVNLAAEQKAQANQQPAAVGPKYTGEPISVNLKDVDLKDFFRLIHEISGLNVVLDPQVHGTLTVVLDDVPWDQALDIVLKNNDLARELEGNVLRIATVDTLKKEAEGRRAQVEAEALAVEKVSVTRFLSYAHAKDVMVDVKKFLSQRGDVVADERTNAIIVNDIPKVIPIIDRLLTQLDRKTQEVEIEARVVAATRQFARDIGTQLGFGWGNGHSAIGGNATA